MSDLLVDDVHSGEPNRRVVSGKTPYEVTPHPDAHAAGIPPMHDNDVLDVMGGLNGIKGTVKDGAKAFPVRNEQAESCVSSETSMLMQLYIQHCGDWMELSAAIPPGFGVVASLLSKHAPKTAYQFAMHVQEGTYSEAGPSWVLK